MKYRNCRFRYIISLKVIIEAYAIGMNRMREGKIDKITLFDDLREKKSQ